MSFKDDALKSTLTWSPRKQPMIENAVIIWRNFSGAAKQFTPEGKRTFNIALNEDIFAQLLAEGFNVKRKPAKVDGDDDLLVLEVEARYSPNSRPPQVVMISPTRNSRTQLDQATVGALDFAVISSADVVINAYHWEANGNSGVKAYLEQAFITIEENSFEAKYAEYEVEEHGDYVGRDGEVQTVRFD